MPRRFVHLATLLAAAVLCSCSDGPPLSPLTEGLALPVTLETTVDPASSSPPRLQISPIPGGAKVEWQVSSAPCLDADASALQSGALIEVRIHRSANPLALCVAGTVTYSYVARVSAPAPGHYEVRVIDDMLGQPMRLVGRGTVAVTWTF
ncbi:MAG TPA: hypothetical protein VF034_02865 [Gemmatimonadaceae bacterium]|jgi:hypothetical protein